MGPVNVITSLANVFNILEVFTKQYSSAVVPAEPSPGEDRMTAQIDEHNELVVKREGEVVQKIADSDFQTVDQNKRLLVRKIEESMKRRWKQWLETYDKISAADDPEISQKYREKLTPIAREMCKDWELLSGILRDIGKPVDKHYEDIRSICAQTNTLITGANGEHSPIVKTPSDDKQSSSWVQIIVAVIALIGVLGAAYMQYVCSHKSETTAVDYTGRVLNEATRQPVPGAKISLTVDQSVPEILYTDSEGVFHFHVKGTPSVVSIRVDHANYQPFDRNVSLTRSGLEDIPLKPITNESTKPDLGLKYSSNPTIEQVRQDLQNSAHVKIAYGSKCPRGIGKSAVELNQGQIIASDVKEYLDQVSPRTKIKFFVKVVSLGAVYEIVCQ